MREKSLQLTFVICTNLYQRQSSILSVIKLVCLLLNDPSKQYLESSEVVILAGPSLSHSEYNHFCRIVTEDKILREANELALRV